MRVTVGVSVQVGIRTQERKKWASKFNNRCNEVDGD